MEAQAWNTSDDPIAMLAAIRGVASERKLRLFSFALCRRLRFTPDSVKDGEAFVARAEQLFDAPPRPPGWMIRATQEEEAADPDTWYLLEDDVCERFDLAHLGFLEAASTGITWAGNPKFTDAVLDNWAAVSILGEVCAEDPWAGADAAATVVIELAVRKMVQAGQTRKSAKASAAPAARTDLCRVLREVFGQPFRPVAIDSEWLTWRRRSVPKLARRIYDKGAFDLMPSLADALQKAGCTNEDILTHCHSPGPHVRGCWLVDAVLGMK